MKLHQAEHLTLFGAGREKKIYGRASPHRRAPARLRRPPLSVERFEGKRCRLCGAQGVYLDELVDEATGRTYHQCNDTAHCAKPPRERSRP